MTGFLPGNSDLGLEIREDVGERFDVAELLDNLLVIDGALLRVFAVLRRNQNFLGEGYFLRMKQSWNSNSNFVMCSVH